MKRRKNKNAPHLGSFAGIPRIVIETEDFKNLSGNAVRLLVALAYQFRGNNNGDLTASYSVMRNFGFRSKATLAKCIQELIDANLIIKTREGYFMNPGGKCALYALTWQPIDECPGKHLEYAATRTAPRKFSLEKNA